MTSLITEVSMRVIDALAMQVNSLQAEVYSHIQTCEQAFKFAEDPRERRVITRVYAQYGILVRTIPDIKSAGHLGGIYLVLDHINDAFFAFVKPIADRIELDTIEDLPALHNGGCNGKSA
jgi:hypothetical protein